MGVRGEFSMSTDSFLRRALIFSALSLSLASVALCAPPAPATTRGPVSFDASAFNGYWNRGAAELSKFELSQARYGELHPGTAVLVYVTEEFLKDRQVKLESENRADAVPILKLNTILKFTTGIYDYSMMSSVFTPTQFAEFPRSLKITASSQEWCGHTFTQFNLRADRYHLRQFSYFEKENDQDLDIPAVVLEDDLWTRLRLSPALLPLGEFDIFPGSLYVRLVHRPLRVERAKASLHDFSGDGFPGENLKLYRLEVPALERVLEIVFESAFPHRIAGWRETREDGWGAGAKRLTTVARRTHLRMGPYWSEHALKDRALRAELGLE